MRSLTSTTALVAGNAMASAGAYAFVAIVLTATTARLAMMAMPVRRETLAAISEPVVILAHNLTPSEHHTKLNN